jgi:hypothetical protein
MHAYIHTDIQTTSDGTHELISHTGQWYRFGGGLGAASVYVMYLFFEKQLMGGTVVDSAFFFCFLKNMLS